jgi:hypothetical protein
MDPASAVRLFELGHDRMDAPPPPRTTRTRGSEAKYRRRSSRKYITVTCRYIIFTTAKTHKEETMTLVRVSWPCAWPAACADRFRPLIKGGHGSTARTGSARFVMSTKDGKIAAVAANIAASRAAKTVDAGDCTSPGTGGHNVHVYPLASHPPPPAPGDRSRMASRSGSVWTTVADAGRPDGER